MGNQRTGGAETAGMGAGANKKTARQRALARVGRALAAYRANQWWEHKLVPALGILYAAAFALGVPLIEMAGAAAALMIAVAACAAYVSVLNDLADREDDLAAGKCNRVAGFGAAHTAMLVAAPVAIGIGFVWLWRGNAWLLLSYLGSWLAFTLYCLPPLRLKVRGFAGLAADAAGAHLFPALLALFLAFGSAKTPADAIWIVAVVIWSFAYGLRGILLHQLWDRGNDERAGVRTFVTRHSAPAAERIGTFAFFPFEAGGLLAVILLTGTPLLLLGLGASLLLAVERYRRWTIRPAIVRPADRSRILLQDFYCIFFPLSVLLAAALREPTAWVIVIAHLLLFHRQPLQAANEMLRLAWLWVRPAP